MTLRFTDRKGYLLTMEEWLRLFGNDDYRQVGLDKVEGCTVSTIWMGINMPLTEQRFETLVTGGPLDGHQRRYATESAAIRGHVETLAAVVAAFERNP